MSNEFSWDVIPPKRVEGYSAIRPQGSVCIWSPEAGRKYVSVPALVARSLARKRKTGNAKPQNERELMELIAATKETAARERVCKLIERRDYASKELYDRLVQDGFERSLAHEAVDHGKDIGLVSDERFAGAYVRTKISAGWGMDRIVRELARRGIDAQSLDGWPYEFLDPDEEFKRALEVASRKHVRQPNAYAKMVRFLMGRGFCYRVATDAAKQTLEQ